MNHINVDVIEVNYENKTVVARITPDTIKNAKESYPAHNFNMPEANTQEEFLKALALNGRNIAEEIERREARSVTAPKLVIANGTSASFSLEELFGIVKPVVNTAEGGAPHVLG